MKTDTILANWRVDSCNARRHSEATSVLGAMMTLLRRIVKRMTGGDRQGLNDAVNVAVQRREHLDVECLCAELCVSQGAVRTALTQRIEEEVRSFSESEMSSSRRGDLLSYADSVGADTRRISDQCRTHALNIVKNEARRQSEGSGLVLDDLLTRAVGLGLDQNEARLHIEEFATETLQRLLVEILADEQVCPDEETYLREAMRRLSIDAIGGNAEARIAQAKAMWSANHGPLPVVSAPILLQRGEVCHHVIRTEALEDRSRTVRVNYRGPSARIRIAKGFYYNMGSMAVNRRTEDYQHSFGDGALCATNKRILWIGVQKTISIKLDSIVHYEPYTNAILVRKSTGKPITFHYGKDDRLATTLISRVIEEQR